MHIKPFQAVYPNFRNITDVDDFFARVKEDYPEFKSKGFFQQADQEAIYIYRIDGPGKSHTGLTSLVLVQDYLDGLIKIHEHTLASKERHQTQLLLDRSAQVKPVLLTYDDVAQLNQLLERHQTPENLFYQTTFEKSREVHSYWAISQTKDIEQIASLVDTEIQKTYIADGHHRSSIMANLYKQYRGQSPNPYGYLLVTLFAKSQLEVHDFNRVVEGIKDADLDHFEKGLLKVCSITPISAGKKPDRKHQMTLFINKKWYVLEWHPTLIRKHENDPVLLDAHLLDKYILNDILGIKDHTTDGRLKYVEGPAGIKGLQTKTLKKENRIGFCLYPAQLNDLTVVADRGEVMPPKSTWFEPRIKNGLLVLELKINY